MCTFYKVPHHLMVFGVRIDHEDVVCHVMVFQLLTTLITSAGADFRRE